MEETTTGKQPTSRRSKEQTLEQLREYDKDQGTTVKAFCNLHQISEGSFYSARNRYRAACASKQKRSGFIALTSPVLKKPAAMLFAEVCGIKNCTSLFQLIILRHLLYERHCTFNGLS